MTSIAVMFVALMSAGAEDAPDADQERQRQASVARMAPAKAKLLALSSPQPTPAKAKLHDAPLLRWSNPTAGSVYGEVFLWTISERPAAIASIYRWYHPFRDATVEFTSVWEHPISAYEDSQVRWQAQSPGLTYRPLSGARPPSSVAGPRLSQMRALAREFVAELEDERGGEAVARQLRLLNQPVHRYAAPAQGVIDGALFAFVEGTDPEAWLLIEVVNESEKLAWRCGLARMNADALHIRHKGVIVGFWPDLYQPWRDRQAPYTLFGFNPEQAPISSQEAP